MEVIELDPDPHLLQILMNGFFKGFPPEAILTSVILLLLLVFSGLISGSETAFFSLQPADLKRLRSDLGKKGRKVLSLRDKPKILLATILISNNFVNVAIVVLSTYLTGILFDLTINPVFTFLVQIVIVTSFLLIFGEIMPKIYANNEPVSFSVLMAGPLEVFIVLFKPLSLLLVGSTSFIDKRMRNKKLDFNMSELSDAIDLTVDESTHEEEKMILKGIATFGEKEASEVMRSRVNVTAIDVEMNFDEVMHTVIDSGYSRIPVFKETFDHVKGILYIKDLLPLIDSPHTFKWEKLIRPAFFIPENKKINDLLQEFRQKKIHLAIVVDEYGGTSGIITLEDILEEIVGEISDEFDIENEAFHYKKLNETTYVFDAKTLLNDLCKILGIDDDYFDESRGESDSLGGLILELEGRIPAQGEKIEHGIFLFEIVDADKRKINEIKVSIKKSDSHANTEKN